MKKGIVNSIKGVIVLLGLFPILPRTFNAIAVGLFVLLTLILFILSKEKFKKSKILLVNTSLYITYVISLVYTENFKYASDHLITALSLLLLPMAFYFLSLSKKSIEANFKKIFFKVFWLSSVTYSFIIYGSFFTFSNPRYPFKDANFFRKASAGISLIGQHPIYGSLILSLAILIGLNYLFKENNRFKLIVIIGEVMILILLVLIMSKGVLLALLISVCIFIAFKIKHLKRNKILRVVFTASLAVFVFLMLIPQKNNRFLQFFNKDSFTRLSENNSTSIRLAIYKCAFANIKKAPFFGYGFGDVRDALVSCYVSTQPFMVKTNYNSHNQYLSIWLGMGIFGLLILFYFIYFNMSLALSGSDYLGFSILVLFSVIMFFENILERQTGVVLFALLINFFAFSNNSRVENIQNK